MRRAGSLLLEIARECAVPAGHALAVDRDQFSPPSDRCHLARAADRVRREEVTHIDEDADHHHCHRSADFGRSVPGDRPAERLQRICISSIRSAPSSKPIPSTCRKVYMAARYDKGSADYINCPMSKEEYDRFCDALIAGAIGGAARLGEAELLRRLPAD